MNTKAFMLRLRPDYLAGQITLLIFIAIAAFQAIVIISFHVLDVEGRRHIVDQVDFVASVILALDNAPVSDRPRVVSEFAHTAPYANISIHDEPPEAAPGADPEFSREIRGVRALLWRHADISAVAFPKDGVPGVLSVALRKGGYAVISIAQHRKPPRSVWRWLWQPEPGLPFLLSPWARSALFFLVFATSVVIWASNGVVAPLVRLAKQAEQFPSETETEVTIAEQGPREIRDLTRSINRMQARIRAMIAARAHVLAAVSHDLRTIITRLKLRTEFISDKELRLKMVSDIDLMDAMLYKNLQYLRVGGDKCDRSLIDIDSVLQTVADQFGEIGYAVTYRGDGHRTIFGSLTEIQRVFANLVENAAHHAENVEIHVTELSADLIQIDVVDDGPGIPAESRASVFEPFTRGQPGRTIDKHGGFGLGLSIVRSLVESHQGTVELLDREPHGLIVRVTLPRRLGAKA